MSVCQLLAIDVDYKQRYYYVIMFVCYGDSIDSTLHCDYYALWLRVMHAWTANAQHKQPAARSMAHGNTHTKCMRVTIVQHSLTPSASALRTHNIQVATEQLYSMIVQATVSVSVKYLETRQSA